MFAILLTATNWGSAQIRPDNLSQANETSITPSVVSVKQDSSGSAISFRMLPDGFTINDSPILPIIKAAYGLQGTPDSGFEGLPSWASTARFDIAVKIDEADVANYSKLSSTQRWGVMRGALEDRFKLTAHPFTKEMPGYTLSLANPGKLTPAKANADYTSGITMQDGKPSGTGTLAIGAGRITGQAVTLAALARALDGTLGRPVADKTGDTSMYDFTLTWRPDPGDIVTLGSDGARTTSSSLPDEMADRPSLSAAIREQLGLKLERGNVPVQCLRIEHIERPSPN